MTESPALELVFPAHARYLSLARLGLAGIAPVAGLDADGLADLKLAVTEACANAVRHAYPDGIGSVKVRIAVEDGSVKVDVADAGRGIDPDTVEAWAPGELRESGMGLAIIRTVMDEVEVESPESGGTVVRLTKHLTRA